MSSVNNSSLSNRIGENFSLFCKKCFECKYRKFSGFSNIFITIINIVVILFLIIVLILSNSIKFDSEISHSISKEFLDDFTEEAYFQNLNSCNANENRIKFGKWEGTVQGCGKIENDMPDAKILDTKKGKCNKGEKFLDNIPSQYITSFKGIVICGKTKGKYYDLLFSNSVVGKDESCPEGMKNCGYIDTVENKLCFKNNLECPISYIKIKDVNSSLNDITYLKEIKNEKIKFFYSSDPYANSSEIPYIAGKFKIAGLAICSLPNLYYSEFDFYNLEAIKKNVTQNCELKGYFQKNPFDKKRYHELNTINHYELYKENGIIDKIEKFNLINYGFNIDKYNASELKLYVGSHFGFNKTCLKKRKTEFNISIFQNIDSTADNMKKWSIITIAFFSFLIMISIFDFFIIKDRNIIMVIKYILTYFPLLILTFYTLIWGNHFDDLYEENMDCSDDFTNSNYNIMIKKIRQNGKYIYFCSILITLVFFFEIGILIVKCTEKDGFCYNCCCDCCKKCCCLCCIKTCSKDDEKKPKAQINDNDNKDKIENENDKITDKSKNIILNQV